MTSEQAVAFLLFAVVAAGTPGPSNLLLTATGANVGVLRGVPCLLGVTAAGTYLHAGSRGAIAQAIAFGGLFVLASLPCCFVWLAFGATAQRWLRTDRARRTFNIAMGLLLAGSVVLILR